jgi:hypothetical protein
VTALVHRLTYDMNWYGSPLIVWLMIGGPDWEYRYQCLNFQFDFLDPYENLMPWVKYGLGYFPVDLKIMVSS